MGTAYLQLHITNRCANRCKHCYQKNYDREDISVNNAREVILDFKQFADKARSDCNIVITGGDPFLHLGFWAILREARKHSHHLGVIGNSENISFSTCRKLKEIGIDTFQVSLDGTKKMHDAIRRRGSFDATYSAIRMLSEHGIKVSVLSTLTVKNKEAMQSVMDTAYEAGASHWDFSRHIPCSGDCGIGRQEYSAFLHHITSLHARYELTGYPPLNKEPLLSIVRKDKSSEGRVSGGCSLGTAKFTMLPDLTLMACRRHAGSVLGKWSKEQGFLWHFVMNEKMKEYRNFTRLEKCKDCEHLYQCRGCRASVYAKHGDDSKEDPQCFK